MRDLIAQNERVHVLGPVRLDEGAGEARDGDAEVRGRAIRRQQRVPGADDAIVADRAPRLRELAAMLAADEAVAHRSALGPRGSAGG